MQTIAFGRFVLDPKRRVLLADGAPVKIQSKPFDILAFLVERRDAPVSRDEIRAGVWRDQLVGESNLTVQMSNLRRVLADHGAADLIVTLPNRGYRFVGEVIETDAPDPDAAAFARPGRLAVRPSTSVVLALLVCTLLAGGFAWRGLAPYGLPAAHAMVAQVRVETSPDEVFMQPGGLRHIDYIFTSLDSVDLQLETEDWQFVLPSGKPVGAGIVGGRIYKGSFPIRGGTTGIYHNNIYLIPEVAALARASGEKAVQIRHVFHLRDALGNELRVPAVLYIHLDPWGPLK